MPGSNVTTGGIYGGYDAPFFNYSGADIPAGSVVKIDTTNVPSPTKGAGVVVTAATTDVPIGIAVDKIPANGAYAAKVRCCGQAVAIANGAVTVGDLLMPNAAGAVSTQTAGKPQIGVALNSATNGQTVVTSIACAKNA